MKSIPRRENRLSIPTAALPYAWMLMGAISFSVMATLAHALGDSCDWKLIAVTRTAVALVIATVLTLAAGRQLVFWRPGTLWIRSIAGSISLLCTFYALTHMPVADVLTLTNVFPIWVALLSWPLIRERPTAQAWAAIAVALLGVVLVEQPHFEQDTQGPALLALLSSLTTSISMLGLHRLQQVDPRAVVVHFSLVSLLACLASLWLLPNTVPSETTLDVRTISMLLAVGACAAVGQIYLTKAFAAGPPAKVSVVALTQVGFALLFEVLLWGRQFGALTLAGMLLVMAPTAWLLISQGRLQVDDL